MGVFILSESKYNKHVPLEVQQELDGLGGIVNGIITTINQAIGVFKANSAKVSQLEAMREGATKNYELSILYANKAYSAEATAKDRDTTIAILRKELGEEKKKAQELSDKVNVIETEKGELDTKLGKLTTQKDELQREYDALKNKYSGKRGEARTYEGQAGSLERRLASANRRVKTRNAQIERLEYQIGQISYRIRDTRRQYKENVDYTRRLLVEYFLLKPAQVNKMKPDQVYRKLETEIVKLKDQIRSQYQALEQFESMTGAKAPEIAESVGAKALENHLSGRARNPAGKRTGNKPKKSDSKKSAAKKAKTSKK